MCGGVGLTPPAHPPEDGQGWPGRFHFASVPSGVRANLVGAQQGHDVPSDPDSYLAPFWTRTIISSPCPAWVRAACPPPGALAGAPILRGHYDALDDPNQLGQVEHSFPRSGASGAPALSPAGRAAQGFRPPGRLQRLAGARGGLAGWFERVLGGAWCGVVCTNFGVNGVLTYRGGSWHEGSRTGPGPGVGCSAGGRRAGTGGPGGVGSVGAVGHWALGYGPARWRGARGWPAGA